MDDPLLGAVFTTGGPDKQAGAVAGRSQHYVAWQEGTSRLLFHEGAKAGLPHLFITPSLINRYWIFDLEGRSLIGHLSNHAHVWVMDWSGPGEEEKTFTTTDYVARLTRAIRQAETQGGPLHLLGYCMGGTLCLLAAFQKLASLILVSPPWDFAAFPYPHHPLFPNLRERILGWLAKDGVLLPQHQRSLFAMAQPWEQQRSALLPHHRQVQAWLEDGVQLAAPVAREWLLDWPEQNPLPGNAPPLGAAPVLLVHPQRDRLVPAAASAALQHELPNITLLQPQSGHIGALVGRQRMEHFWKPLTRWLSQPGKV